MNKGNPHPDFTKWETKVYHNLFFPFISSNLINNQWRKISKNTQENGEFGHWWNPILGKYI